MYQTYQPPAASHPIWLPTTIPNGIAHHLPSPLDIAAAAPPPNIPPAIFPSVQSLLSYSIVVLRVYPPLLKESVLCWHGTSIVSWNDWTYPGFSAFPGIYSSLYSVLKQLRLVEYPSWYSIGLGTGLATAETGVSANNAATAILILIF